MPPLLSFKSKNQYGEEVILVKQTFVVVIISKIMLAADVKLNIQNNTKTDTQPKYLTLAHTVAGRG
jgi:hypothetical protein